MRYLLAIVLPLLLGGCFSSPVPPEAWARYVNSARADGLLRTETRPEDASFTRDQLVANFETIAFSFERSPLGILPQGLGGRDRIIRKWAAPVVYSVIAEDAAKRQILPKVKAYMERLSDLTGHEISAHISHEPDKPGPRVANLTIVFADEDDFRSISRGLARADFITRRLVHNWRNSGSPCAATVLREPGPDGRPENGKIERVAVVIRREIPELLLDACVEEELAQSMGLFNDDDDVRPSIFNDDQEFALLTEHDEMLLRILYDPRLKPGMTPDQAMPIVRRIAVELVPGT